MTDRSAVARLEALEMRAAHQERVIEDLNATVTGQWRRLDALERALLRLEDRLSDAEARPGAGSGAPEPPPPHY